MCAESPRARLHTLQHPPDLQLLKKPIAMFQTKPIKHMEMGTGEKTPMAKKNDIKQMPSAPFSGRTSRGAGKPGKPKASKRRFPGCYVLDTDPQVPSGWFGELWELERVSLKKTWALI